MLILMLGNFFAFAYMYMKNCCQNSKLLCHQREISVPIEIFGSYADITLGRKCCLIIGPYLVMASFVVLPFFLSVYYVSCEYDFIKSLIFLVHQLYLLIAIVQVMLCGQQLLWMNHLLVITKV